MSHSRRIAGLDGLRGLAIILIFFYHLTPKLVRGGFFGVDLFFILSGFLLYRSSSAHPERAARTFYRRRLQRLYPPLLATLFLVALVFCTWQPVQVQHIFSEGVSVIFGYNNWYQIFTNHSYFARLTAQSPLTHLWFIGVIAQFYLFWPLLFRGLTACSRRWGVRGAKGLLIGLILLSAALMALFYQPTTPSRSYYGTDTRCFSFLIGTYLGLASEQGGPVRHLPQPALALLEGILLIACLTIDGQAHFLYRGGFLVIDLLIGLAVWEVSHLPAPVKVLDHPALVALGQVSYELYLVHYPLIFLISFHVHNFLGYPAAIAASLAVAVGLHLLGHAFSPEPARLLSWQLTCLLVALIAGQAMVSSSKVVIQQQQLATALKQNQAKLTHQTTAPAKEATGGGSASRASQGQAVTMIGDSVTLGASPALQKALPGITISAKEGRQLVQATEIVNQLKAHHKLNSTVVIALGTNGPFTPEAGQALINLIGKQRQIYWVTVYGTHLDWQNQVNHTIRQLAAKNRNVHIIDWHKAASGHADWFYSDGIHLQPAAQPKYAKVIKKGLAQDNK